MTDQPFPRARDGGGVVARGATAGAAPDRRSAPVLARDPGAGPRGGGR
jgi:hypothetical protein